MNHAVNGRNILTPEGVSTNDFPIEGGTEFQGNAKEIGFLDLAALIETK